MDEELDAVGRRSGNDAAHPCEGCLHYYGCYEITKCCNYIFDNGKPRPCKPGTECTVKRLIRNKSDLKLRKARGFLSTF